LTECHYCGRRFPQLYKLTLEDVQREKLPQSAFHVACADCLGRISSASHLIPEESLNQAFRNFAWMIPLFSLIIVSAAVSVSEARVQGLGQLDMSSRWLGGAAVLVGTLMVWDRSKNRYAFTHDLKWSLNSRRVNIAVAVLLAGMIVLVLSEARLLG